MLHRDHKGPPYNLRGARGPSEKAPRKLTPPIAGSEKHQRAQIQLMARGVARS
jgi:hypothetical protein